MKRKASSISAVGGSSLMSIFAVLCLVCFALLSISTVQSQKNLSEASAQAVADYYRADTQAEEILAMLRRGEVPAQVERDGDVYRYVCPISQNQQLEVEVLLEGEACTVQRWQAVSTLEWTSDDALNVWSGV